jgi:uncharacterized protein (TIGR00369 family)
VTQAPDGSNRPTESADGNQSPGEMLKFGQKIFAQQAFSELLGARLTNLEPGRAEIRLAITDKLRQQRGVVHGGVLNYLADNALTFAGGSLLSEKSVTLEMKINYMRPALEGELIVRAVAVHAGKRVAITRCDVLVEYEGSETLLAVAQGTIITAK